MSNTYTGSWPCKGVKYKVTGEAKRFLYCQCSCCRKSTSSAHADNLFIASRETE